MRLWCRSDRPVDPPVGRQPILNWRPSSRRKPRSSASSASPGTITCWRPCGPISTRVSAWSPSRSRSSDDHDRRVFFDAEHFFDGYRTNPDYALAVLRAAHEAGAERLVLCDTNGGNLPRQIVDVIGRVERCHSRCRDRCPLPQRRRLRGGLLSGGGRGRSAPDPGMRQRLRRAHRQCRPLQHPPGPGAEDGPAGPLGRNNSDNSRRSPITSPRSSTSPSIPIGPTWAVRRLRTRPASTPRRSPAGPTPTSTSLPVRSATAPGWWCPNRRGGLRCSRSRPEFGLEVDRCPGPLRSSSESKSSNMWAISSRRPTALSSCW